MYVGRFAPSPTGPLHFGSLVAALASYLDARAHGGVWLLRIEDVDETRCRPEHAAAILDTLRAFGFRWDGAVDVQSQCQDRYRQTLGRLKAAGLVYGCRCSRREVADAGVAGIDGPVYPGTCMGLGLSTDENAARFRVPPGTTEWEDRVQGRIAQDVASAVGDFVLRRRDGFFSYQLAVVADDAAAGATHVVRGADLIDSTPRQILLQRALGVPTPVYLHIPVAADDAGQKLSKQTLAPAIAAQDSTALSIHALRFLGQDVTGLAGLPPATLLETAARRWQAAAIPRARSRAVAPGIG